MTVAEHLAEALHSRRVVIWGPPPAHPPIFSGSSWDKCAPLPPPLTPTARRRRRRDPSGPARTYACSQPVAASRSDRSPCPAPQVLSAPQPLHVGRRDPPRADRSLRLHLRRPRGARQRLQGRAGPLRSARQGLRRHRSDQRPGVGERRRSVRTQGVLASRDARARFLCAGGHPATPSISYPTRPDPTRRYVFRPQPWLAERLAAAKAGLEPKLPQPSLGLHLRLSDNEMVAAEYNGRPYTNKPLLKAKDFRREGRETRRHQLQCVPIRTEWWPGTGISLSPARTHIRIRRALAGKGFASVFLATDTHRVEKVRKELAEVLSVPLEVRTDGHADNLCKRNSTTLSRMISVSEARRVRA